MREKDKSKIFVNNVIKKLSSNEQALTICLVTNGWTFEGDKIISKHGGVTIKKMGAAVAFQDFMTSYLRIIEQKNLTELIMIKAKDPKLWEEAMWLKFTDSCLERAKDILVEDLLDE